jgi:tetratricopeptide (TPR) repeat protein
VIGRLLSRAHRRAGSSKHTHVNLVPQISSMSLLIESTTTARATRILPSSSWLRGLVAALVLSGAAWAQDTVTLKDGKTEQGRVKSAEYDGVAVEAKGQSKTIEWSQVASITYKDPPAEYDAGREAFEGGRFDEAIAAYDKLRADTKLRAPIRQDGFYFVAASQLAKGAWDEAIGAFDALRKEYPKSRYLMEVGEGYLTAYSAKKDFAGAQKALDALANDSVTAGVPAGFNATISFLKGRLLEDQNKVSEAAAAYGVAEKAAGVSLIVQQQARLGQGRCLLAQKKYSDAETLFRKLTTEDAPNLVLAGAWNGIADAWVEDAKTKNDAEQAEKLLDAAYAYMRGVVQFGPGPGESVREYKRSLNGSVKAFQALAQVEKNKDRQELYRRRAAERKAALDAEFPGGR